MSIQYADPYQKSWEGVRNLSRRVFPYPVQDLLACDNRDGAASWTQEGAPYFSRSEMTEGPTDVHDQQHTRGARGREPSLIENLRRLRERIEPYACAQKRVRGGAREHVLPREWEHDLLWNKGHQGIELPLEWSAALGEVRL